MRRFQLSDVVRAHVVAGDLEIPYLRAGRGEPVVLLADDREFTAALLAALPRHLAVVVPQVSRARQSNFVACLWTFLDALGIERATFVLTRELGDAANTLQAEPNRVAAVVLVDGALDDEGIAAAVGRTLDFVTAEGSPGR